MKRRIEIYVYILWLFLFRWLNGCAYYRSFIIRSLSLLKIEFEAFIHALVELRCYWESFIVYCKPIPFLNSNWSSRIDLFKICIFEDLYILLDIKWCVVSVLLKQLTFYMNLFIDSSFGWCWQPVMENLLFQWKSFQDPYLYQFYWRKVNVVEISFDIDYYWKWVKILFELHLFHHSKKVQKCLVWYIAGVCVVKVYFICCLWW